MKKVKDTKGQVRQVKRSASAESSSYASWIAELKRRCRATQIKAAVAVNSSLIEFYWTLGRDVTERYSEANLGNEFYRKMSLDLKDGNEEVKGLSPQTLKYCGYFYRLYAISAGGQQVVDLEKMQQVVAQLILVPWGHHVPHHKISDTDIATFNAQYPRLAVRYNETFHDRFLIIDDKELYLIGASLKDLGRKCFGFTKMDAGEIERIKKTAFMATKKGGAK